MAHQEAIEELCSLITTDYTRCVQCGRCSANCPAASEMDVLPNRMVWYTINKEYDLLLEAKSPWKCMSCFACAARCPRGVSPAHIMEAVRLEIIRQQGKSKLTPEMIANMDPNMPQQAFVAAFRKFSK